MRHSLYDYSLNLPEEQYHALPYWSYSTIAKYARNGFSSLTTIHDRVKPTPEMEFGSLFDSFITKGKKTLEEYAVVDYTVPPAEKAVLDTLAVNCTNPEFYDISMNEVIMTSDAVGYQPKWKPDTRYAHISEYSKYYDTIKSGKKIVSKADWDDAMEMYRAFRSNPYLSKIFGMKDTETMEFIYQGQFKTDFWIEADNVIVKIMPDLVVVDHENKTIQLVDLKTSSMPAYDFADHFVKMRYDIQGELYGDVLKKVLEDDVYYSEYKFLPYLFVDISRSDKVPVAYKIDLTDGFSFSKGDKTYQYKGWKDLLAEILVYEANEAKVPDYVTTAGPNDLIEILER